MAAAPSVLCAFNGLLRAIDDGACGARVFPVRLLDYAGVLLRVHFILILTVIIGLATAGYAPRSVARSQLVALVSAFTALPLMFAIPFQEAVGNTSFLNAWFEMVSCFTTTGATVYENAGRLTPVIARLAWPCWLDGWPV